MKLILAITPLLATASLAAPAPAPAPEAQDCAKNLGKWYHLPNSSREAPTDRQWPSFFPSNQRSRVSRAQTVVPTIIRYLGPSYIAWSAGLRRKSARVYIPRFHQRMDIACRRNVSSELLLPRILIIFFLLSSPRGEVCYTYSCLSFTE